MRSVDVVIPCYKYGQYLAESVGSVLDQPGVDVRVLVIDDASPDDSAEQAQRLADADPRVSVVVHEENRGHIATFNEGMLGWCEAEYSVLLSADDRLAPGALARATDFLGRHPECGFVYGRIRRFGTSDALPTPHLRLAGERVWSGEDWLEQRYQHGINPIASPEVVCRTSLQQDVGGYEPGLPHTSDLEMWMRFAARADVGYLRVGQAHYRQHDSNMSTGWLVDGGVHDLRERSNAYESFFRKDGDLLPDLEGAQRLLRTGLAREALWLACCWFDRGNVDLEPVTDLEEMALTLDPEAERLRLWRELQFRRRMGSVRMRVVSHALPVTLARRARHRMRGIPAWVQR